MRPAIRLQSTRRAAIDLRPVAALVAAIAMLSSCGGGSKTTSTTREDPFAAVHTSIHEWVNDFLKGDYEGVCNLLTASARATYGGDCAKKLAALAFVGGNALKQQLRRVGAEIDNSRVSVQGDTATLHLPGNPLPFAQEGGRWLMNHGLEVR
jgi:hypothetical protein